jgi:hypothetical protein
MRRAPPRIGHHTVSVKNLASGRSERRDVVYAPEHGGGSSCSPPEELPCGMTP